MAAYTNAAQRDLALLFDKMMAETSSSSSSSSSPTEPPYPYPPSPRPGRYSYASERPKLEMHTNWMRELTEPIEIVDALNLLREGKLPLKERGSWGEPVNNGRFYPKVEFDTLVATGLSGVLPLLYVAKELGVNWLAVRKEGENTHTNTMAEGSLGKKWLFLDDFMETGKTLVHVLKVIERKKLTTGFETEWVGGFQYHDSESYLSTDSRRVRNALRRYGDPRQENNYDGEYQSQY